MRKCHNYHAILHKLYTWFGKNQLRLYLNGAKKISIGGRPPSKYAHVSQSRCRLSHLKYVSTIRKRSDLEIQNSTKRFDADQF